MWWLDLKDLEASALISGRGVLKQNGKDILEWGIEDLWRKYLIGEVERERDEKRVSLCLRSAGLRNEGGEEWPVASSKSLLPSLRSEGRAVSTTDSSPATDQGRDFLVLPGRNFSHFRLDSSLLPSAFGSGSDPGPWFWNSPVFDSDHKEIHSLHTLPLPSMSACSPRSLSPVSPAACCRFCSLLPLRSPPPPHPAPGVLSLFLFFFPYFLLLHDLPAQIFHLKSY